MAAPTGLPGSVSGCPVVPHSGQPSPGVCGQLPPLGPGPCLSRTHRSSGRPSLEKRFLRSKAWESRRVFPLPLSPVKLNNSWMRTTVSAPVTSASCRRGRRPGEQDAGRGPRPSLRDGATRRCEWTVTRQVSAELPPRAQSPSTWGHRRPGEPSLDESHAPLRAGHQAPRCVTTCPHLDASRPGPGPGDAGKPAPEGVHGAPRVAGAAVTSRVVFTVEVLSPALGEGVGGSC